MSDLLFLDDERQAAHIYPNYRGTMYTCRTVEEARAILNRIPIDLLSLDHDLGPDEDAMSLVNWMEVRDQWPLAIRIHSMNPVGRQNIERVLERNGWHKSWVTQQWTR